MKTLSVAVILLGLHSVARAESASSIAKSCAPVRDVIDYTAKISGVPTGLLTALFFAESTCNPDAINERTGARGLGQVALIGAGSGYTSSDLTDKWINASIAAAHLAMWARRCKSWLGAVEIYNGRGSCKARSEFGAKVVRYWKMLEREMEKRS